MAKNGNEPVVQSKDLSSVPLALESSEVLKAIKTAIAAEAINKAIANSLIQEQRQQLYQQN